MYVHSDRLTISTRGLEVPNRFSILDPPPSFEPSYRTWERGWKYSTRRASKVLDLLNTVIYRMTRNTRGTSILSYSRTPIDRSTLDLARYYYYFSTCMSWYLHAGTCADRTWFIMVSQPRLSKVPSYRIIEVCNKFSQVDLVLGT